MGYTRDQLVQIARQSAQSYGVDPNLYVNQIEQESHFNPQAVSQAGAQGIAQFMPGTAAGIGLKNPFDPISALDAGAKYLSNLHKKYGRYDLAFAAYNAGTGNVDKYGGIPPFPETQHYVSAIMGGNGQQVDLARAGAAAQTAYGKTTSANLPASPVSVYPSGFQSQQEKLVQMLRKRTHGDMFSSLQQDGTSVADFARARMEPGLQSVADTGTDAVPTAGPHNVVVSPSAQGKLSGKEIPVVQEALRYMGTPYKWGGESPSTGFDCSGFTQYLYAQQGVRLPRTAAEQYSATARIAKGDLAPGDLVFFRGSNGGVDHMGLYLGGGNFIHSPHTGDVVKISNLSQGSYAQTFAGGGRP